MKVKISIAVITILAVVGLLWFNRPAESVETTSVAQVMKSTPAPTATLEPTIELKTTPVVEVAEGIYIEVSDEGSGVSQESIVDVSEEVEVEEQAEVEPTATPKSNVTVKTEEEKRAETPIPSEADLWAELGLPNHTVTVTNDGFARGGNGGTGIHYGDVQ